MHAHPYNSSKYNSDLFSIIGTLLLFLLWPSFNAVVAPTPDATQRTYARGVAWRGVAWRGKHNEG